MWLSMDPPAAAIPNVGDSIDGAIVREKIVNKDGSVQHISIEGPPVERELAPGEMTAAQERRQAEIKLMMEGYSAHQEAKERWK